MGLVARTVITAVVMAAFLAVGASKAADLEAGKAVFAKKCANCHGDDGKGNTSMAGKLKVTMPDLTKASDKSDADLMKILTEGKKPMTGYGKSLDQASIDNVFAYTKSLVGK